MGLCKKVWFFMEEIVLGFGFLVYVFKLKMYENVEICKGFFIVKLKVWDVCYNEKCF